MSIAEIIASASGIIALCALLLTMVQIRQVREHARLSVRPYLVSERRTTRDQAGVTFAFVLCNVGLGPAILDEFKFTLHNKPLTGSVPPVEEILAQCVGGKFAYQIKSSNLPGPGYCLVPKHPYVVAEVSFGKISRDDERAVDELISGAELDVTYSSFHREKRTFSTRKEVRREAFWTS